MKKNYKDLLEKVRQRSNPDGKEFKKHQLNESLNIPYNDVYEYVRVSMLGVPEEYTLISNKAAEMVIENLKKSHGNEVDFKLQGSVVTNTHIWSENDIDLVQITNKSNAVDTDGLKKALLSKEKYSDLEYSNLKKHSDNFSNYLGNQLSDLGLLRKKSEIVLTDAYDEVNIDKPKAICVKMKNPVRNVDVVTAVYYKHVGYMKSNEDFKKGIQIYDKDLDKKLPVEFPFWSIKRIQERNILVNGRFKKMIRFMKNVKYDTSVGLNRKLSITSFDINAICYNIDIRAYNYVHYLELVAVLFIEISKLVNDIEYRNSLKSVDGEEDIFKGKDPQKLQDLIILKEEIDSILGEINLQKLLVG